MTEPCKHCGHCPACGQPMPVPYYYGQPYYVPPTIPHYGWGGTAIPLGTTLCGSTLGAVA